MAQLRGSKGWSAANHSRGLSFKSQDNPPTGLVSWGLKVQPPHLAATALEAKSFGISAPKVRVGLSHVVSHHRFYSWA